MLVSKNKITVLRNGEMVIEDVEIIAVDKIARDKEWNIYKPLHWDWVPNWTLVWGMSG